MVFPASNLHAANLNGTFSGAISGDSTGTFTFTITNDYNVDGVFKYRGGQKLINGAVESNGTLEAAFEDKRGDARNGVTRGTFRGKIAGKHASGTWEVFDASATKASTSKGKWSN